MICPERENSADLPITASRSTQNLCKKRRLGAIIAAITGASTVTISRVNRLLYEGNTGMEMAAKRINLVPSDDSENS